ncbi:Uncharacterized protein APZ42_025928 [Daphnia magna]|uniref:Integrase catalytic domain-containing protein n=1 Tax=Daphnia magna TaxID=35525 RepID=A0A164SM37_9CRUS|nr:Uncharacterized protein APZ42_025928 [Daphnia magna]
MEPHGYVEIIRVERSFEKVGIEVLWPFPVTNGGIRNAIVAVDYLAKWLRHRALPTATAKDAAEFLNKDVAFHHGAPESIVTDCGKCFMPEFNQSVTAVLKVNHHATTPYHPQSNGLVERLNHTLADMLLMYVNNAYTDWDTILPYRTFAYYSSRQESIRRTPFFWHGREAILPIRVMMNGNPNPVKHDGQDEFMKKVQDEQKDAYYTRRRIAADFKEGDKVLVYKPFRKVGWSEKLVHRWRGPYVDVRETSSFNYGVKLLRAWKSEIIRLKGFAEQDHSSAALGWKRDYTARSNSRGNKEEECVSLETSHPEPQAPEQNKEGKRRSERSRKQPKRYGNPIIFSPFMLLSTLLCEAMPCVASPRERFVMDGVVFQNLEQVNFSDSEWVVVTEVSFRQVEANLDHRRQWLAEKLTEQEDGLLPEDLTIGEVGLRHPSLPQFLTVAGDQQTFIELSEEEVRACKDSSGLVCPLARAIERKNAKKKCVMALFLQDIEKKKHECEQVFGKWKGPEALYLGQRQWALSIDKTQTLVIPCPARAGGRKQYKRELATVDYRNSKGMRTPVIPTEGYQLDAANSIDIQFSKIGVYVITIYNRFDPWNERGSPNSGRVSWKIYRSAKRRENSNPSTVNPVVLPIRIVGGYDSHGYGKSHFVVSILQGKPAPGQRKHQGADASHLVAGRPDQMPPIGCRVLIKQKRAIVPLQYPYKTK